MKKITALMMVAVMMLGVIPADVTFAQVRTESTKLVTSNGETYNVYVDKSADPYGDRVAVYSYKEEAEYNEELINGVYDCGTLRFYIKEWDEDAVDTTNLEVSVKDSEGVDVSYTTEVKKMANIDGSMVDRMVYTVDLQKDINISFTGVEVYKYSMSVNDSEDDEYEIKNVRREYSYQLDAPDEYTEGEWLTGEETLYGEYNEETDKIEYKDIKWMDTIKYDVEVKGEVEPLVYQTYYYKGQSRCEISNYIEKNTVENGNTVYTYSMFIQGDIDIDVSTNVRDIKVEYVTSDGREYLTKYMTGCWYIYDKEVYEAFLNDEDADEVEFIYAFNELQNKVALDKPKNIVFNYETFYGKVVNHKKGTFLSAKNDEGDIIPLEKTDENTYTLPVVDGYYTLVANIDVLKEANGWVTIDNKFENVVVEVVEDEEITYEKSTTKDNTYYSKDSSIRIKVTADNADIFDDLYVYSRVNVLEEESISDTERIYTLSNIYEDCTIIVGKPATAKFIKKKDFFPFLNEWRLYPEINTETDEYYERGIYAAGETIDVGVSTWNDYNYDLGTMVIKHTYVDNGVEKEIFYNSSKFSQRFQNESIAVDVELKPGENIFSIASVDRMKYKINIPSSAAYTITNVKGVPNSIEYGMDYSFKINPTATYELSNILVIIDGGYKLTPVSGVYTIKNVKQNYTVSISGYKQKTCTVTFKSYDGKTITTQKVVYGKGATAPSAPSRKGYKFKEWSTSYSSIKKDTVVTAKYSPIYVSKVAISGSTNNLGVGKSTKLTATVTPTNALNKSVIWSSSNKKYATVSSNGTVKALAAGAGKTVTITAKAKDGSGKKAIYKIKIYKKAVTKVTLSSSYNKVYAGKKVTLKAKVAPSSGAYKTLKWTSSNTKYATVSSKGVVTTKAAGAGKTVTITATALDGSGKKATYKIKIYKNAVKKITLSAKSKTVKAGKKVTVKAKVTPTSGVNKTVKWSVSNKKYATVNSKGVVTTKNAGKGKTVTVTATATDGSGKKGTIKIKIK